MNMKNKRKYFKIIFIIEKIILYYQILKLFKRWLLRYLVRSLEQTNYQLPNRLISLITTHIIVAIEPSSTTNSTNEMVYHLCILS